MNLQQDLAQAAQLISEKNVIVVCLPKNPSIDALGAGASLYLALSSLGKTVSIVSETPVAKDTGIVGAEKVGSILVNTGNTLLVSFPFKDASVDETSYYVENNRLHVVIRPSEGHEKINFQDVQYVYTGGKPDLLIMVESPRLESLGTIYTQEQETIAATPIINIDRRFNNTMYGKINVVDKQSASVCQIVLRFLQQLRSPLEPDIATNLYKGIVAATNQFTSFMTNADSFEAAALLLKSGAQLHNEDPFMVEDGDSAISEERLQPPLPTPVTVMPTQESLSMPITEQLPTQATPHVGNPQQEYQQQNRPDQQSQRSRFRRQQRPAARTYQVPQPYQQPPMPRQEVPSDRLEELPVPISSPQPLQQSSHTELPQEIHQDQTPQDWLKPKIFKPHTQQS